MYSITEVTRKLKKMQWLHMKLFKNTSIYTHQYCQLMLSNHCSPWQLQHPLVRALPSDKSIKKCKTNGLASVTTMLASREHDNSKSTSGCTAATPHMIGSAHQASQPWQELCKSAGLAATSTS
jgi:hypothetical protein